MEFIRTVPAVRYGEGRVAAPDMILSRREIVVIAKSRLMGGWFLRIDTDTRKGYHGRGT